MKRIITQSEIKLFASLIQKKYRKQNSLFLVEGSKLVDEVLKSRYKTKKILTTELYFSKNKSFFSSKKLHDIEVIIIKEKDFQKISDAKSPQGIIGICEFKHSDNFEFSNKSLIGLENISDPGNLGTIIRNCDWFGFDNLILSEKCAEVFSPKVLRASMGSVFHTNVSTTASFIERIYELKQDGYKIYVADMKGEDLYDKKIDKKSVIVLCNEANGPSKEINKLADSSITIPKYGQAESLNVASASAVILSHMAKLK
jgi:TrmH family RNA methyltransferase